MAGSINSQVGDVMAGAAAVALAVMPDNRTKQANQTTEAWMTYARKLENKIEARDATIKEQGDLIALQDSQIHQKDQKIAEQEAIQNTKAADLQKLLNMMTAKSLELERMLKRQSCNTKVVTVLYNNLLKEIEEVSDPNNFASLDPVARSKIIHEEWENYEQTGEMVYLPRLADPNFVAGSAADDAVNPPHSPAHAAGR